MKFLNASQDANGARSDSKPDVGRSTRSTGAISRWDTYWCTAHNVVACADCLDWEESHGGMNGVCC
jgi:hypothetical protein